MRIPNERKKIILINTGIESCFKESVRGQYSFPPYGLLSIASVLTSHGYDVKLIDIFTETISQESFISNLEEDKNNVLAVGITTYTESFHIALSTAMIVKKTLPSAKVIMGGIHASFRPSEALDNDSVDYVVAGEGESTIVALLELIKYPGFIDPDSITGIVYSDSKKIMHNTLKREYIDKVDCLPLPSYYLIANNRAYSDTISIISSRGCPGQCIFCASRAFSGKKYRMHSALWLFSLLYHYKNRLKKFNVINFMDDTFTANKKRLRQFNELLKYNNWNVSWACKSRADSLDENTINILAEAGCRSIHIGVESGDQKVLDSIDKRIDLEKCLDVIGLLYNHSIRVECSFIIGLPEDTKETIDKTMILATEINNSKVGMAFIGIATPFPGTKLFENAKDLNISIRNRNWKNYTTRKPIYYTQNFSIDDLRNANYFFNFDKQKLEGNSIISSSDLSEFRNKIITWAKQVRASFEFVK